MNIELDQGSVYILPDGTEIHVTPDYDADCPMSDWGIPIFAYREPRLGRSKYSDPPTDEILKIFAEYVYRYGCEHRAVKLTQRYARVFLPHEEAERAENLKLGKWTGYSQGDWLDYVYISEYDESEDFNLYLQGDVSEVKIVYPEGEVDYIGGITREFGRVRGEDIGLDLSGAREAQPVVTYV